MSCLWLAPISFPSPLLPWKHCLWQEGFCGFFFSDLSPFQVPLTVPECPCDLRVDSTILPEMLQRCYRASTEKGKKDRRIGSFTQLNYPSAKALLPGHIKKQIINILHYPYWNHPSGNYTCTYCGPRYVCFYSAGPICIVLLLSVFCLILIA